MKFTFKTASATKFDDLGNGQTFIDPEIDDSTVFIKASPNLDLNLTTDLDQVARKFDGYAVDLYTGEIGGYYADDEVIPVTVEATVIRN